MAPLILALALVAAGCGSGTASPAVSRTTGGPTASSPRYAAPTTAATTTPTLPVTPVQWSPCGDLQCGTVAVPLDYARPGGPIIQIAVARHPAEIPSERIGSLVINPGGPGTSGIDDLPDELSVLTPELLDRFDIVSFDPRGVDRSDPVDCATPGQAASGRDASDQPAVDPVPTTPAEQRALLRNDEEFAALCEQDSGSILPFVGTVDTARDLDRIREALGDAQLTFMGNSYGTLLGATYAELFPAHVRAMVLDSAIDPALTSQQYAAGQADAYETALGAFSSWCASDPGCPWNPTGDPAGAVLALIQRSESQPIPVESAAPVGPGELYDALLAGLESSSSWPTLATALAEAEAGNGAAVAAMTGRYETGGSSNGADAEQAIDCLDHPVSHDPAGYPALAAQLSGAAPVFGPFLAWAFLGCATWPVPPTRTPAPASDPGAPPILVVGTTGDPVTPYAWSVSLAHELSGGVLLTWDGNSHVAYFSSPCVRSIVQTYLVEGTPPSPGTTCTD